MGATGKKENEVLEEPITDLVSRGNIIPFRETAFQEKYLNIFTIKQFNFPVPSPATPPSPLSLPPKSPQIVDFLSFLAELPEEI